ncbi:hypothetical protein C8A03DRAFT_18965 [Achaetomium macrosporum]|uniref:Uncharacterized protein n=1 Tax=Achaetomium macrosporum TaxID=79813 RepID=A0AAN7C2L6_9PEZI|nr:hypothetical protein C8A03DRAFT_18965 [Achaetomium macrosporum]
MAQDYTFISGPITVKRVLEEHHQQQFMRSGYRFRIINTWRSALPRITDLPLGVCDFRSLNPDDVVESDRVRPDKTGEIFHVYFNPEHKWHYLDNMTDREPLVFVSYDSMAGNHARCELFPIFFQAFRISELNHFAALPLSILS